MTNNQGDILQASISTGSSGDGAFLLEGVKEISELNMLSLLRCRVAAEWLTSQAMTKDVTIELSERRNDIQGSSWELMLTLGLASLLSGIPLDAKTTGSGRIGQLGTVINIGNLAHKAEAAMRAGFSRFFVSKEQPREPTVEGIEIYPVENIREAWEIAGAKLNSLQPQQAKELTKRTPDKDYITNQKIPP